jgi:hypothetical protein
VKLHPLAELYREAERVARVAAEKLAVIEAELEDIEERLTALTRSFAMRYGIGYLTVKSVRNSQGKRYRYLVWRTMDGKDVYLRGKEAEEVLELRMRQRELRIQYSKYKRALRAARLYMKSFEEYKDVCIAENGEYVDCAAAGRRG